MARKRRVKEIPRERILLEHRDGKVQRHWVSATNLHKYRPTGDVLRERPVYSRRIIVPVRVQEIRVPGVPLELGVPGEEIPEEEEKEIVEVTLHFKIPYDKQHYPHLRKSEFHLDGYIKKRVYEENIDSEIQGLMNEVDEIIRATQYGLLANYLVFGEPERESVDSPTDGYYDEVRYQYWSSRQSTMHERRYVNRRRVY